MAMILVLDPTDGPFMRSFLREHGYDVRIVATIDEALIALKKIEPNLIILDHDLPQSGFLLLPKLGGLPAIVCSAEHSVANRVTALRLGADDFIPKPYDPYELVERVKAVLRRSQPSVLNTPPQMVFTVGDLSVDTLKVRVTIRGREIHITPSEFHLLVLFAKSPGRVISSSEFGRALWGHVGDGAVHALNVRVGTLRKRLAEAGLTNPRIVTNPTHGYSLVLRDDSPVTPPVLGGTH